MTVVLITGALTGIGRATAVAFANVCDQIVVSGLPATPGPIWWRSFARSAQRQSSFAPTCGMTEKCGA